MNLEELYTDFINNGPDGLYDRASFLSIISNTYGYKPGNKLPEEILLKFSYDSLKRARELEEDGKPAKEWREMSKLLRSIAHNVFYNFGCKSSHPGFLRLI